MHASIAKHLPEISAICRRYGVRRLELFGSAARSADFVPGLSDADFLIEFAPDVSVDLHRFFGFKTDLEQLLSLSVDLVEPAAIRNPYMLADINRSRQSIYGS
jgi:predicted nucleotidyltransferase